MSYLSPTDVADALESLSSTQIRIIAGCTDYFPSRKPADVAEPLLDVTRIKGFRGIERIAEGWRIGAATTWTDIIKEPLPAAFDGLKLAAREVGSVQIQNRGTIAGNICNASPAADGVPPLLALDAEIEILSKDGMRRIDLSAFITGVRQVALQPDELVSAVIVPVSFENVRSGFLKLGSRTHLVISIAMVGVTLSMEENTLSDLKVAVGSCSPVAKRLPALEKALDGLSKPEVLSTDFTDLDVWSGLSPISDVRGTDTFRREAAAELCKRAILQAMG